MQEAIERVDTGKTSSGEARMNWLGVVSFGEFEEDARYRYNVGAKFIRLQPGYECVREVTCNNAIYTIHCKIIRSVTGPRYSCFLPDESHNSESDKPTKAMTQMFSLLGVPINRHRSGYEFFGFNTSEFIAELSGPYSEKENVNRKIDEVEGKFSFDHPQDL